MTRGPLVDLAWNASSSQCVLGIAMETHVFVFKFPHSYEYPSHVG